MVRTHPGPVCTVAHITFAEAVVFYVVILYVLMGQIAIAGSASGYRVQRQVPLIVTQEPS